MDKLKLRKLSKVFIIIGLILLLVGAISIIVGLNRFGTSILNESDVINGGLFSIGGIIGCVIGILLALAGSIMMLVSHTGEVVNFANDKVIPSAKKGIDEITPTVQKGIDAITPTVNNISDSLNKGFNAAKEEWNKNKKDN